MQTLRWGFLSTANIGRKNWNAISHSGNNIVTAVASRNKAKSREFIRACQDQMPFDILPDALGSYEELLASKDVDAVYIPLPTALRKDWVVRAAEAGKHVLCEKPTAVSHAELVAMTDACAANGVQFMDGVMFMHSDRLPAIRHALADGASIGQIRRIASQFSFCGREEFLQSNIRAQASLEPAGCLGDLGWYCIRFALWTLGWQLPREISARKIAASPTGAPTEFSVEMFFANDVSAQFYCAFNNFRQQWINVSGTHGYLQISDFVNPFRGEQVGFYVVNIGQDGFAVLPEIRRVDIPEHGHNHPTAQESKMFRNFAAQIASGTLNADWPMWALATQRVMDAALASAQTGQPMRL